MLPVTVSPEPWHARHPRQVARLAVLLPIVAATVVYWRSLDAGFVFDDPKALQSNPVVNGSVDTSEAFRRNFWGDQPGFEHITSWRPLSLLTLRMDWARGDGTPSPFHALNLILHLLVVGLVALLGLRLNLPPPAAGVLALIVAVHPAFAEAVVSIVGRADILAAAFGVGVLALLPRLWPAALLLLACGFLAKETVLVVAAAAIVWNARERRWVPAAGFVAVCVAWYLIRSAATGAAAGVVQPFDNQLAGLSFGDRLGGALGVLGRYLEWFVLPQPVAADHSAGVALGGAHSVAGALGLVALGGWWTLALAKRWKAELLGLTIAGSALLLLSNLAIVLPTPLAGRLAYLPAIGLALAAVAIAVRLGGGAAKTLGALAAIWLVFGVPQTLSMVSAWSSDRTLFELSIALEPASTKTNINMAIALKGEGKLAEARALLERARKHSPDRPEVLTNLALVTKAMGGHDAAWELAKQAAAAENPKGRATANLCSVGLGRKDVDPATLVAACEVGARVVHDAIEPVVNYGRALARAGHMKEAEAQLRVAVERAPTSLHARGHWVTFLMRAGRHPEAIAAQRELVRQRPQDDKARGNLVAILLAHADQLAKNGRAQEACEAAREAEQLIPAARVLNRKVAELCP